MIVEQSIEEKVASIQATINYMKGDIGYIRQRIDRLIWFGFTALGFGFSGLLFGVIKDKL